jgi:hypothetical protein
MQPNASTLIAVLIPDTGQLGSNPVQNGNSSRQRQLKPACCPHSLRTSVR